MIRQFGSLAALLMIAVTSTAALAHDILSKNEAIKTMTA
jgi:hypothetical protein